MRNEFRVNLCCEKLKIDAISFEFISFNLKINFDEFPIKFFFRKNCTNNPIIITHGGHFKAPTRNFDCVKKFANCRFQAPIAGPKNIQLHLLAIKQHEI